MAAKNGGNRKPSSSWGNKILEELVQARGIDVDIKKDSNIAEILRLDRNQLHKIVFDNKHEIQILCPPEKISENINAAIMQYQITGYYLGNYDFEEWFKDFEYEFKKLLPTTKQVPLSELKPWGNKVESRPKKLNLLSLDEVNKVGYQKILFWRNRKNENDSVLLTGTYYELKRQLLDLMRSTTTPSESLPTPKGISERKYLSGHPKISLIFRQISELKPGQKTGMESELSLTLTEYSERNDGYGFKVLSNQDLKRFAEKIKSLFVEPELFKLERGREGYSYQDWKRGYGTWSNFLNKENAFAFYQKYVQIKGDVFDPTKIGTNLNEYKDDGGNKIQVLGEDFDTPKRYQKATLALWVAFCYLPETNQKIVLVSRSNRQLVDPRVS